MIERFGYKNVVAAVYISALFMQIMDATIINVALPTLAEEFGVEATSMDWTVLAFTLALGVMTPTAGWIGDRLGLKPTFLLALAGFTTASAICGATQSLDQLVLARVGQGVFAGLITPIGSAILFNAYPVNERSIAARKVITVAVIAPALGPITGGLLIEYLSWRWIFYVNVPVGVAALALAWYGLRNDPIVGAGRFDISGFILAGSGLGLTLYGISRGSERGWDSPVILLSLVGGVGLLAVLAVVELRITDPLLALRLNKERLFRTVNIVAFPTYASFVALIYLLPLYLQDVGSSSALDAGLALFPQPLAIVLMSQVTGRLLYKQFGPRRLIVVGCLVAMTVGILTSTLAADASPWAFRGLLFVRGLAMGLIFIPINTAVYTNIAMPDMARATAMFVTIRQVSPAVGVAIGTAIVTATLVGTARSTEQLELAYQRGMLITSLLFGVAAVLALLIRDSDAAASMAPST